MGTKGWSRKGHSFFWGRFCRASYLARARGQLLSISFLIRQKRTLVFAVCKEIWSDVF